MLGSYLCALQDCITSVLLRVEMKLGLFDLKLMKTGIIGEYVLRDIIVHELAQGSLERPTFD